MKNGFITLKGGHRVGLGGKVLYGVNGIETIKDISSLNIRIAREKRGVSEKLIKFITDGPNKVYNTLIVSPPQCGKTTMLRDLIRILSNGDRLFSLRGMKVGVIDERFELAGVYNGMPQFDIGMRTDVLAGCNKRDGTIMLIRAMSPDVIAMDEIGSIHDVEAIHEAIKAGIRILATIHGDDLDDLISKRSLKILLEEKVFKRYIFLDNSKGVGTVKDIIDGNTFKSIYKWKGRITMPLVKLFGSILIIISTSLIGFYYGDKYSDRLSNLIYLEQCFKILETEIVYGANPLPEALTNVYKKGNKKVSFVFKEISDHLKANKNGDLFQSFHSVVGILRNSLSLKDEDIELFLSLGRVLGSSDRKDQEKNFNFVFKQISVLQREAKIEKDKNEKLYKNLGILSGITILIILL